MAAKEVAKDKYICSEGQALDAIHIIVAGSVKAQFPGGEIILKKGDVVGLCDIAYDSHFFNYITLETSSFVSLPIKDKNSLTGIIKSNAEAARMMYTSMINQVFLIMASYAKSKDTCSKLYTKITEYYSDYVGLCAVNNVSARSLPQFDSLEELTLDEDVNSWLLPYYVAMKDFPIELKNLLASKIGYLNGFINQASIDIHSVFSVCEAMEDYINENASVFMQESRVDLFDLFISLYSRIQPDSQDGEKVVKILNEIGSYSKEIKLLPDAEVDSRLAEITAKKAAKETAVSTGSVADLTGSLDQILEFSGVDDTVADEFKKLIGKYKKLSDKTSTEDDARRLRNEITKLFYEIYAEAFQVSIRSPQIPTILKMFFNFGYVDEELAGIENANYMYSIAENYRGDSNKGVYTAYEWLLAIYRKEKEPSRNEFDTDFLSYLHEQKVAGKIDAATETRMGNDPAQRVEFELTNMFPLVNKVTYGRLSIFCPVFSEHNVIKPLQSCTVDVNAITGAIENLEKYDYGAFYRETVFVDEKSGVTKEFINVHVTPDFILCPNVGTRGVMWQEIEGKKRTTPARFMVSAFHLEDLNNTVTKLVGEYRWEMCKRIQGARWNDISDRSLTSEYNDYVQFYKKNSELSAEAKEKIKNALVKAKNSYKELFARDYMTWVLFEGTGSPRLNKLARQIMCTYCPFPAELRKQLVKNPIYKEMLEHYEVKTQQKLHHIDNVITKINSCGQPVPPELLTNRKFVEGIL